MALVARMVPELSIADPEKSSVTGCQVPSAMMSAGAWAPETSFMTETAEVFVRRKIRRRSDRRRTDCGVVLTGLDGAGSGSDRRGEESGGEGSGELHFEMFLVWFRGLGLVIGGVVGVSNDRLKEMRRRSKRKIGNGTEIGKKLIEVVS